MAGDTMAYLAIGVLGAILLGHWFPSLKQLGSNSTLNSGNIIKEDIDSIIQARMKGLI